MVHLGNVLVHLHKAGSGLSAGDGDQTFLDDGAVVILKKEKTTVSNDTIEHR